MNRRQGLLAAVAASAAACDLPAWAQSPALRLGELKSLGQERFQIGRIVVDKGARRFAVPGRVHALGKPLEYLATSPGGMKAYETLLEVDASGSEFNLACILLGLQRDAKALAPGRRLAGPPVALYIAWSDNGARRQVSAAEALLDAQAGVKPETVEWVYTGSLAPEDQARFLPDETGTLVGFVHDPNTIIESAVTIGVGAYGSVRGHSMLPAAGTAVELIVEATSPAK